ncbi:MAG TPA: hypothetical protein VIC06_09620 [Solirubrobacteraceae bacterium]
MPFLVPASSALADFGFKDFEYSAINQDQSAAVQAGSHPWALSTSVDFNSRLEPDESIVPDGDVKDIEVDTPLGLVGNPATTPKCTIQKFTTPPENKEALPLGSSFVFSGATCPDNSQVGVADVRLNPNPSLHSFIGVYNLEPPPGVPAEFGFDYLGLPVLLKASLRPDGSYGLAVSASDVSQTLHVFGSTVTLWGVPADPNHDGQRGECLGSEGQSVIAGGCPAGIAPAPFLTLPTSCSAEPPTMSIFADSWQDPAPVGPRISASAVNRDAHGDAEGITGCDRLDFSPSLTIRPDAAAANSPTGLEVDLSLPQNENPHGLSESHLRDAVVTLPPGLVVNPSTADGLEACSSAQIDLNSQDPAKCPAASKMGSVTATTPLLTDKLEGSVYLAQQEDNPFGSLLAIYVVAEGDGVRVKLAGEVHADPVSGQLTTTFNGNRAPAFSGNPALEGEPQLPFSDLRLRLFAGPRAALMTPGCGEYAASALLTPWSGSLPVASASPAFTLNTNCGGGFAPSFKAGTVSNQAGGFSPLVTSVSRGDQDQRLGQVSVKIPPGVLGMLSRVSLCGESQAQEGTCPASSQIGHVTVTAGAGPNPVSLPQAGRAEDPVYLTVPYKNAPFGLAIVVHPEAGPFNLGPKPIVVRAGIYVDPKTAQITVTTDPLPTILRGIPLDVRAATVTIDRAGATGANQFIFNPTNCEALSSTGTIASTLNGVVSVSSRFQAADCESLPFKPSFKASTQGVTSKKLGASLDVKVTSGPGQANIGKVFVTLPKQLPARLTTLQKACTEAAFAANPATCPVASDVGFARAVSPVLKQPLVGPAYLVSHGGAAFPDLVVVLQGEGIRLDLVGNTNIRKGITTSTFNTVPDAPISRFELRLPRGAHSALGSNLPASAHGSFCSSKLALPVILTSQNGVQLKSSGRIAVSGCSFSKARRTGRKASKAGVGHEIRHGKT